MEEERKDIQELLEDIEEPDPVPGSHRHPGQRSSEPRSRDRDRALEGLVKQVENENTRDYIENRVIAQMKWYSKRSREYRKQYQWFTTVAIVLGALIPVASVLDSDGAVLLRVLIALLGSSVTAINAFLSLQNSKDLWLTYRGTRENLLRTLYYYFNGAGIFKKGTQQEKDDLLIDRCEMEMAMENGSWRSIQESQMSPMGPMVPLDRAIHAEREEKSIQEKKEDPEAADADT